MPLDLIQTELGKDRSELTETVEALNARFRHHSAHDVMHGAIDQIEDLDCPTVSAINGFCLGGGLELAMSTDYRLALPNKKPTWREVL